MTDDIAPYGAQDARTDAARLRANPADADLLAAVRARLTVTDAVYDPTSPDHIDPSVALAADDAFAVAEALDDAADTLARFPSDRLPPKPKYPPAHIVHREASAIWKHDGKPRPLDSADDADD